MEDSPLGLDDRELQNGISSYEVHRAIGITQKSACFIVLVSTMQNGSLNKLSGSVEIDDMHKSALRKRNSRLRLLAESVAVIGPIPNYGCRTKRSHLHGKGVKHVETGSTVYTDALRSYNQLDQTYIHVDGIISRVAD